MTIYFLLMIIVWVQWDVIRYAIPPAVTVSSHLLLELLQWTILGDPGISFVHKYSHASTNMTE